MSIIFPDPEHANEDGIVAMGGLLSSESLLAAYSKGIFPWPVDSESPLLWFSPDPRGILFFDKLKVGRTTKKYLNKFDVYLNRDFSKIINACALSPRGPYNEIVSDDEEGLLDEEDQLEDLVEENETWITEKMISAYTELHEMGYAHCVSCYSGDVLVGGIYGVLIGGYFSCESMFYTKTNASKVAFVYLVEQLKRKGLAWMDTQVITPVVESFGASFVGRTQFLNLLQDNIRKKRVYKLKRNIKLSFWD